MAKISQDCIEEAFKALKHFGRDALEDYVHNVFMKAKSYDALQGNNAIQKAMQEVNADMAKSYFNSATQKAKNVQLYEENAKLMKEGKANVRSLLISRFDKFLGRNISNAQKAQHEKMAQYVLGDLSPQEVESLSSGKFDQLICDVFDGKHEGDPFTKKMADKIKNYYVYRESEEILSGAMKFDEINGDRFFRAVHDPQRIINADKSLSQIASERITKKYDIASHANYWRNFIKPYLNLEKTFSRSKKAMDLEGNLNMAEADKILDNIFNNITTGKSNIFTRSVVANDREALERKSHMFFYWKDLRSQYEYNKKFGQGNLFHMLMSDIKSTSNKVGVAQIFGDNPYAMYNDLRAVQHEIAPGKPGVGGFRTTDQYFNEVMQVDKSSVSPTTTSFLANLRSISTMARLPFIAIQSISDQAYIASFAQRMGINYFKAYGNLFQHIFDKFPTEERKRIAKQFLTLTDSHLGYLGRWNESNNVTSLLGKISTKYFKINGLEAFDRGNKIGIMHMMSKHLYDNSNVKFSNLSPELQKWVGKFLDEKEWNLLRKKNKDGLFTTENVDALTNDEIKTHYESMGKNMPLGDVRGDLYRKVHSMFTIASENAVLSPTEFERAWLLQGTTPGTAVGEILRLFTHFKMYTMSYIDRVLVQGFREADTATQKLKWAMSMLIGTLPLSYASELFNNLAQGRSMPDWDAMNVPERGKFLVKMIAPSLSIFTGIMDPSHQNANLVLSLLGSPSISMIGYGLSSPLALFEGDPKRALKNLTKAAGYLLPIQTTPLLSPLIREAMGDEAHLEPGQTHLYGK